MKKVMKILMILVLVLGVSACGSNTSKNQNIVTSLSSPVEIEFWHGLSGKIEEELETLTNEFNKTHPNITVKLVNQGSYADLSQKVTTAAQSKKLPALTTAYPSEILQYAQQDLVVDLAPYIENSSIGLDKNSIYDAFYEECNINGAQLALPFTKSTEVLTYNKTALDELGKSVPTNWDEVFDVSKAFYEKTGKPGFGVDVPETLFAIILRECGVDNWKNEDGTFNFNNPKVAELVTKFKQATEAGYMRLPGTDKYLSTPFGNGDLLMYTGSIAGTTYIDKAVNGKFEWNNAKYPAKQVAQQGPDIFAFSTTSPEQQYASYEYMKYLVSTPVTTKWAIATGYLPVTKEAMDSSEYQQYLQQYPRNKAGYEERNNMGAIIEVFPGSKEIYAKYMREFMISVLEGGEGVEAGLKKLDSDSEQAYNMAK